MVMFSCNRCSKGLKKKDVLTHSYQCGGPNNINVTCIDCLKDFRGNEYDSHTSCVTEEVRYGGKGAVVKETGKKQNQWLGIVRQVLKVNDSLDIPVKKFLQSIQHMENIPRNQKKFHNWANSAMHIKDRTFLDKVFQILQAEFQKSNEANKSKDSASTKPKNPSDDQEDVQTESGPAEERVEKKEKKKKKSKNHEEITEEGHTEENGVNGVEEKRKNRDTPDDVQEELDNGTVKEEKPKKKKKKKRNSDEVEEEESIENAEPMEENGGEIPEMKEDDVKLSKKERKMKKKKAKFESELREIENFKKEEVEENIVEEAPKTKKSKKRKLNEESNVDEPDKDGDENDSKRKKVVEDRANENGNDESVEPTTESPSKKQKFNWHQMIVEVLKKSKDDEVSVKKITKKVINEYVSRYGDIGIHEKLNAKMTKKLKTCPGIRVLKDKVKLLETDE
uniref:Cell growth-regulating nucleolar protein n=1 Tax=Lygus hesperus TaxID=30085 RepID=A0A146KSY7_LYGHE